MITVKSNEFNRSPKLFDTGFVDRKGRKIGYLVEEGICEFVNVFGDIDGGYNIKAGIYFTCKVSKTKDGKIIGSSQPEKYFKHEYQRDDEIKRRREAIIKNAVKGF